MEAFLHVRFADVDENFIKTEVQSGFYTNETELVRGTVRRMREEKERAKRFQEAIRMARNGEPYSSTDAILKCAQAWSMLAKNGLMDIE